MKLRQKLPLAFTAVALVIAAAGLFGLLQLNQSIATFSQVIAVDYANEQAAASMQVKFKTQVQEWKDTLLRGKDPLQLDKYWSAFQSDEADVATAARALQQALAPGDARTLVDSFVGAHQRMGEHYRQGFAAFKASSFDPAAGDLAVKGMDRAPSELINQIRANIIAATRTRVADADAGSRQAMLISLVLMLAGFICSVIGGMLFSRSISKPLDDCVAMARRVASGDLSGSIVVNSADEIGQLRQALKAMNDSLADIVSQVRAGSDAISVASGEIASGNLDLASRTEQQAATLEETASSMEELTATVRQNADHARQANRLASAAASVAGKGGTVIGQVVHTMGSINASSRQIGSIVSVIDGIAFQTNILALNAAVEAARAGAQGRGFAVVAGEVRNLAQRCAGAASEIRLLIGASVDTVAAGGKHVEEAGNTMQDIVDSIQGLTGIMADMCRAGLEQTAGIEQVNQAVCLMDNVTQQNAALVEQAAAAAAALREQALRLVQTVSVFRLGAEGARLPGGAPDVPVPRPGLRGNKLALPAAH